jgi:hypothetical protein
MHHELDFVYITSDGKKFLNEQEAKKHESTIMQEKNLLELVTENFLIK